MTEKMSPPSRKDMEDAWGVETIQKHLEATEPTIKKLEQDIEKYQTLLDHALTDKSRIEKFISSSENFLRELKDLDDAETAEKTQKIKQIESELQRKNEDLKNAEETIKLYGDLIRSAQEQINEIKI